MPRAKKKLTLGGRLWTAKIHALQRHWGLCWWKRSSITLNPDTIHKGNDREILLHECTHAICPFLTERTVNALAKKLDDELKDGGMEGRATLIRRVILKSCPYLDYTFAEAMATELDDAMDEFDL